jgi:hypothetical protein
MKKLATVGWQQLPVGNDKKESGSPHPRALPKMPNQFFFVYMNEWNAASLL